MSVMISASDMTARAEHVNTDSEAARSWDQLLEPANGHLLQSYRWGEFKRLHGWRVERIRTFINGGGGQAQVLYKHRGPISIGYIPRGPVLTGNDYAPQWTELAAAIDISAARHRALTTIMEPNVQLDLSSILSADRLAVGPPHIQPSRTVKVPLLEDQALLDQMHQKTRYSVRLAQRRGVEVREGSEAANSVAAFFSLLEDTARRNKFAIHPQEYYSDFLRVFEEQAILLLAYIDEDIAAGIIAARFGAEAIYMYGGSSTEHRAHGAAFLLQFEAMKWARENGCTRYDLWGIPKDLPHATPAEGPRVAATQGADWRGLYKFKVGFGGEIIEYPPTVERRHRPVLASLARRVTALGG
jgi:lipid II:glycine glycyltransferase (peptidoglycan interpeptide bridge formation enzyme)